MNEVEKRDILDVLESYQNISKITFNKREDACTEVMFDMKVRRPPRGFANEVQETERVWLVFMASYPITAPGVWLRPDFSRRLPHINSRPTTPTPGKDYVSPCIIDEPLDTFFHYHGLAELVHRVQKWLDDAAFDTLTRDDRFWEPMRRDGLKCFLTGSRAELSKHVTDQKGRAYLYSYVYSGQEGAQEFDFCGHILNYEEAKVEDLVSWVGDEIRRAVTVLLWGKKVVDKYAPDTVQTLGDIDKIAEEYGCKAVKSSLVPLISALNESKRTVPVIVFIVFAIRRPKPLPGNREGEGDPNIEYVPYACYLKPKDVPGRDGPIRHFEPPESIMHFGLRYEVNAAVLEQTSGIKYPRDGRRVMLIGCGSLGSKIAVHLGKSGFGDFDLIDWNRVSPHNLARMGLINERAASGILKVSALQTELNMLGYRNSTTTWAGSAIAALMHNDGLQIAENTRLVIDATASINVHNALCRGKLSRESRVCQTSFMAGGRIGTLLMEGPGRKPDVEDLKAEYWRYWLTAPAAEHEVWGAGNKVSTMLRVGEGCESATMIMSDMAASLLAAGVSNDLSRALRDEVGEQGRLSFGICGKDGRSVIWRDIELPEPVCLKANNDWDVHILPSLARTIDARAKAARKLETGGYLMGRINVALRRITLTAEVPPPRDSVHRAAHFILGTEGASRALLNLHERSRGAFLALGTWHSHPMGGQESHTDIDTLQNIARDFCGSPAVSLIWRPEGFHVVVQQDWAKAKGAA